MSTTRKGNERRPDFLKIIADAFIEGGYRQTTTAELARRCEVRENELYRIWPSKKEMFLESIEYIFTETQKTWEKAVLKDDGCTSAERLLAHQARDHGHRRFYRIVFSGITEVNDPDIRLALKTLYRRFHQALSEHLGASRSETHQLSDQDAAWAIIGIGAIVDIQRELGLATKAERGELLQTAAMAILNHQ